MRKQTGIFLTLSGLLFLAGCGGNTPLPATPTISEYRVPTPNDALEGITAGPDGNVWFTEPDGHQIGRITPAGQITEFPLLKPNDSPDRITAGPDGALWFTDCLLGSSGTCASGQ